MATLPVNENDTATFLKLLDIDPHERIDQLEQDVAVLSQQELATKGLAAYRDNDTLLALVCLERVENAAETPELASCLGFCLAKERGQYDRAISLCKSAMVKEPKTTHHYLNLARIYLMQGKKKEALATYQQGLQQEKDPEIITDLQLMGSRRRPVIPILQREHILNRSLGYLLNRNRHRQK